MYPASSPGVSYAYSMQPERQGFQNLDQTQGYVQVQTTAQVLQPGPGNFGSSSGQRVGPSGPAILNFPPIPGHQTSSSAPANSNSKTPYYCTYIPAPTFQFPAIPGVSEYQRSSVAYDKEEAENTFADEKKDYEEFLHSKGVSQTCSRTLFVRTRIQLNGYVFARRWIGKMERWTNKVKCNKYDS